MTLAYHLRSPISGGIGRKGEGGEERGCCEVGEVAMVWMRRNYEKIGVVTQPWSDKMTLDSITRT